jgi:hypothetical protein
LRLGNGSWVVRSAAPVVRAYEKYMEGASGVYGRWTALGMSFVCLSMPGGADGLARVHITDGVAAGGIMRGRFRRSGAMWRCGR